MSHRNPVIQVGSWVKFIKRENLVKKAFDRWTIQSKVGESISRDKVVKKYLTKEEKEQYKKLDKEVEILRKRGY